MPPTSSGTVNPGSALITGASRRLGLYVTEQLLRDGWRVHAQTRSASDGLNDLSCEKLTIYETTDYSDAHIRSFISTLKRQCKQLDLLVNNASIYEADDGFSRDGNDFYARLMFIHMSLPALLMSKLHGELQASGGNVISVTDIYASNPNQDYSLYCSTKAGLQNLTLGFAKKFAPGVRVNCVQPGPVKFLDEHEEKHKENVLKETLLAYEGGFEPILQTIKFLIANPYITGECIKVDGGRSLVRG